MNGLVFVEHFHSAYIMVSNPGYLLSHAKSLKKYILLAMAS